MRLRVIACLAFVLTAFATPSAQPAADAVRIRAFNSVAISPDGTRVVSVETPDLGPASNELPRPAIVVRTLASNARVDLGCPTTTACRLGSPVWSPRGDRIAYLVRLPKTNESAGWTAAANGSGAKAWLYGYKGVLGSPRWSPDGTSLAVLATANALKETGATQAGAALVGDIGAVKSADVQRIAVVDARGTLRYESPGDLFVYEYDWIPNGRGFVATGAHGNGDNAWWTAKLYRIDAATAAATVLFSPPLQIDAPKVSADGATVAFVGGIMSDFGSVGGDVFTIPLAGGAVTDVTPEMPASANALSWAGRSDRIVFTALAGDASAIDTVDLATKTITSLWSAPETIVGDQDLRVSLAQDGTTSAIVRETYERAAEIYAGPLGTWRAITHDNDAVAAVTKATSVAWTNEGYRVQGWLLAPLRAASGKRPMVVEIHGGPSAASTPRFVGRGTDRDLLAAGYYLFLPNPRGSFGQGERFTAANVKDFG
ncbi:MAG: PD40 domain-containing protein, partial [Candidatus Eremiobacteraeota bacterium]|nr:PD40 domain-containing protein [Candidatus Eremiobacteraeota bacterium]